MLSVVEWVSLYLYKLIREFERVFLSSHVNIVTLWLLWCRTRLLVWLNSFESLHGWSELGDNSASANEPSCELESCLWWGWLGWVSELSRVNEIMRTTATATRPTTRIVRTWVFYSSCWSEVTLRLERKRRVVTWRVGGEKVKRLEKESLCGRRAPHTNWGKGMWLKYASEGA